MKRSNGYYWVKFNPEHYFQIAEYIDGVWLMMGTKIRFTDDSYCKIIESMIAPSQNILMRKDL